VPQIDALDWRQHWLISTFAIGFDGLLMLVGGGYVFAKKRLGYAIVAAALVGLVLFNVLLHAAGYVRYTFERTSGWGSLVTLSLAAGALIAYRRSRVTADTHCCGA
jgi:hypothetical protein